MSTYPSDPPNTLKVSGLLRYTVHGEEWWKTFITGTHVQGVVLTKELIESDEGLQQLVHVFQSLSQNVLSEFAQQMGVATLAELQVVSMVVIEGPLKHFEATDVRFQEHPAVFAFNAQLAAPTQPPTLH